MKLQSPNKGNYAPSLKNKMYFIPQNYLCGPYTERFLYSSTRNLISNHGDRFTFFKFNLETNLNVL